MEFEVNSTIAPVYGMTTILTDAINAKYDSISNLNSIKLNAEEENFEDINPVIDSIIDDENNHIGKLQQLVDLLNGSEDAIAEGKAETIEIIDNPEIKDDWTYLRKDFIKICEFVAKEKGKGNLLVKTQRDAYLSLED